MLKWRLTSKTRLGIQVKEEYVYITRTDKVERMHPENKWEKDKRKEGSRI